MLRLPVSATTSRALLLRCPRPLPAPPVSPIARTIRRGRPRLALPTTSPDITSPRSRMSSPTLAATTSTTLHPGSISSPLPPFFPPRPPPSSPAAVRPPRTAPPAAPPALPPPTIPPTGHAATALPPTPPPTPTLLAPVLPTRGVPSPQPPLPPPTSPHREYPCLSPSNSHHLPVHVQPVGLPCRVLLCVPLAPSFT